MYIWEQTDWPRLTWQDGSIAAPLAAVRHDQGRLIGRMEALGFKLREEAVLQKSFGFSSWKVRDGGTLAIVEAHADSVVVMAAGRVALAGPLNEVLARMLSEQVYEAAVPSLRRLKAALETEQRQFSAWMTAGEAAAEINACLKSARRLSLSA